MSCFIDDYNEHTHGVYTDWIEKHGPVKIKITCTGVSHVGWNNIDETHAASWPQNTVKPFNLAALNFSVLPFVDILAAP